MAISKALAEATAQIAELKDIVDFLQRKHDGTESAYESAAKRCVALDEKNKRLIELLRTYRDKHDQSRCIANNRADLVCLCNTCKRTTEEIGNGV